METRIAENIRAYRKQRGLTQEQLSEVLGVSVGAEYKWESRSSLPELRLIMEMADFFDVSVDALLGYKMKDNQLNATVERLREASRSRNGDALSEAEEDIQRLCQILVLRKLRLSLKEIGSILNDPGPGAAILEPHDGEPQTAQLDLLIPVRRKAKQDQRSQRNTLMRP